ncbi:MAG: acyl carrier protein [Myxococcaceae bacterium]
MSRTTNEIIPTIRRFITEELLERELIVSEDTPLIEGGYLTSLQTIELVSFLMQEFAVEIEPEEINEQEFRSLTSISELVQRKSTRAM